MDIATYNHADEAHNLIKALKILVTSVVPDLEKPVSVPMQTALNKKTNNTSSALKDQDVNTDTVYQDTANGQSYKIVITNGVLTPVLL